MKTKISKKIGRRGKIGLTVLIAAMFIGVATAGVLTYFGEIKTTANIEQAVVIGSPGDWHNYDDPIEYTIDAIGGDTFCYDQWIWNKASIPVDVTFDTNECEGITTTYLTPLVILKATGDSTAEWTDAEKKIGSYSAKLFWDVSSRAFVDIDIPEGMTINDANSWSYWINAPEDYAPNLVFYLDTTGNGESDTTVSARPENDPPNADVWYQIDQDTIGGYQGAYVVWEDGTGCPKYKFLWSDVQSNYGSAEILKVKIGKGSIGTNQEITVYVDDFTLNAETYGLDDIKVPLNTPFTLQPGQELPFRICYTFDLHCEGTYVLTTLIDATEA